MNRTLPLALATTLALLGGDALLAAQFALKPRDVIFIASNDLARFNRVMGQAVPSVNLI